ncbi:RluA family pseudouridine synthase [Aureitalea marina]|uniref:RNA pseudouridine synthase n=1 Tax=Aureitalea marina TaxID=930804 RepID=A0A2S7KTL4_9FLAO|nr:RluA family pseudouridine synthase [Aureitalea marina]PQB05863.1 RNA pseudouridine synthase [Aureitalea marina]
MSISHSHSVPSTVSPERIQEYGVGLFDAIPTKSALKKALKKGHIRVNDRIASTATMIQGGETIVYAPPLLVIPKRSFKLKLQVIYEDDHLAIIDKPAGILVSGNQFRTIANALSQNLEVSPEQDAVTPQPAHRLDFATTGILLIGKTAESLRRLSKLFEEKKIRKCYYAVTIGEMNSSGIIDKPIDGKKAVSTFKCVASQVSPRFKLLNLVKLEPETGRRHQLRIHLSELGNPILGDRDYTPENLILKGKGMYLHAFSLELVHPFEDRSLVITAPFPERFIKLFPSLGKL